MNDQSTLEDKTLRQILDICLTYISDDRYVYKRCHNGLIVILEKTENTITNESRSSVVDSQYAKFRGNEFDVVVIFDSQNPQKETTTAESIYDSSFEYNVWQIVKNEFDPRVEN